MLARDFAVAWRKLAKRPGATILAIVSLAMAIGFSTAAFSVVDAYYWRALAVSDPATLAHAAARDREGRVNQLSWRELQAVRRQGGSLAGAAGQDRRSPPVRLPGRDEFPITAGVSNNFFDLLGVKPAIGTVFHENAAAEGQVVISHRFWQRAFGGDLNICGRAITVGNAPLAIMGVLPPDFTGTQRGIAVDLFVPQPVMFGSLRFSSPDLKEPRFETVLRLKPGATLDTARRDLDQALRRVDAEKLAPGPGRSAFVVSFLKPYLKPQTDMGDIFPWLAGLVLAIAAANFANLRLVENQARRRETGIRLALGAGRLSIFRQYLTESLLLAGTATALGLLLADWLTDFAPSLLYAGQRYAEYHVRMDGRVFAFSAGAMLLVAAAGALIPLRDASKWGITASLRASVAPSASRWLAGLVILQIGLVTAFTHSALLMYSSLRNVSAIRPAMDPDRKLLVVQGSFETGVSGIDGRAERVAGELAGMPGVLNVAYCRRVMMAGYGGGARVPFEQPGKMPETLFFNQVSPSYFAATGARILKGRAFGRAEGADAAPVMMVSQAFERKFFPAGDALGNWARVAGANRQIIGVVEDGPVRALKEEPQPFVYFPFAQRPSEDAAFLVHLSSDPRQAIATARELVRESDAGFLAMDIVTLAQHLRAQRKEEELAVDVSGGLAVLGMALAAAGLFGVTLYAVNRRTKEFGIRVAMGASPRRLAGGVLREALALAAVGIAAGAGLALAGGRLLRTYLYGVETSDAGGLFWAAGVVVLISISAAVIPARRAARADAMAALRAE